jgi:hypothetical protein
MGAFTGAGGEVTAVAIGSNGTGYPNLRMTFRWGQIFAFPAVRQRDFVQAIFVVIAVLSRTTGTCSLDQVPILVMGKSGCGRLHQSIRRFAAVALMSGEKTTSLDSARSAARGASARATCAACTDFVSDGNWDRMRDGCESPILEI